MTFAKPLILASRSPRRQSLLRQIGLSFEVRESNLHEPIDESATPEQNVIRISSDKAAAVVRAGDDAIIIGADTIVVRNGAILGKPVDGDDAVRMLALLSNREHDVFTGFTLLDARSGVQVSGVERTLVRFRALSLEEIRSYVAGGSPMDKAGAYGIQDDYGAVFVERIEGCFYNVVGFPLTRFYLTMLSFEKQLGLQL